MSNAIETLDGRARAIAPTSLAGLQQVIWTNGLSAAAAWAAAALVTATLPDIVPWGSDGLFAIIMAGGALGLVVLAFVVPRLGRFGEGWIHYGPWLIAIGERAKVEGLLLNHRGARRRTPPELGIAIADRTTHMPAASAQLPHVLLRTRPRFSRCAATTEPPTRQNSACLP